MWLCEQPSWLWQWPWHQHAPASRQHIRENSRDKRKVNEMGPVSKAAVLKGHMVLLHNTFVVSSSRSSMTTACTTVIPKRRVQGRPPSEGHTHTCTCTCAQPLLLPASQGERGLRSPCSTHQLQGVHYELLLDDAVQRGVNVEAGGVVHLRHTRRAAAHRVCWLGGGSGAYASKTLAGFQAAAVPLNAGHCHSRAVPMGPS